jgi:hypothetical protein
MTSVMKMIKSLEFPEGALLFCTGLALLFGFLALLGYWEDSRFLKSATSSSGEVVGVRVRTEIERPKDRRPTTTQYYTPVVSFIDAQNKRHEFEGRYETLLENAWKVGQTVRVLYPRSNPAAGRIDDPSQIHVSYRAMRNVAFISLIVGVLLFSVAKFEASRKARPIYRTDDEARRAYFGE